MVIRVLQSVNTSYWQTQCCGAGAGAARSRIFWSELEPDPEP
jgi:hypothetical protein